MAEREYLTPETIREGMYVYHINSSETVWQVGRKLGSLRVSVICVKAALSFRVGRITSSLIHELYLYDFIDNEHAAVILLKEEM